MPRAYVATKNSENLVRLLEAQDFEAIPLTPDSIIDNIRSLESSNFLVVDAASPSWVMREAHEHHKLVVAFETTPEGGVTAFVDSEQQFDDLLALLKPLMRTLTPVSEEFVRRLAIIVAMYPVRQIS